MTASLIDEPRGVRQGEELPLDRLAEYLRGRVEDWDGPLAVKQFPSGHSNLTFQLQAGDREMILRRPPFGAKIKTAHDMGREFHILSNLHRVYGRVPRPLLYCEDESIIGAPFYLMERVQGIILRARPPAGLTLTPELMHDLSTAFVDNLAEIHAIDYEGAGLGDLGRPAGYAERQVRGWTERYRNAMTDDVPDIERTAAWLADALRRLPAQEVSGAALIHNDYKYDNLVLDPVDLSIRAVLDWEMATVGDPLMDLGTSLGYWVEANDPEELRGMAFCLTMLPGNLTRAEVVERYSKVSGRDVSNIQFYYVYALFKIAVIVQQIYNRWKQGFSQDPRFANLIIAVRVLGKTAVREIERG